MSRRAQQPQLQLDQQQQDRERREDRLSRERVENGDSPKSGRAIVVRVYWMLLGFIPLVASVAAIVDSDVYTTADLAYWASVSSLVLARLYDVTRLNGRTADGDPASLADWSSYSGILLAVAGILWFAIHSIPNRG